MINQLVMNTKSVEITTLLEKMKVPLAQDWEDQKNLGQRVYSISFEKLQGDMNALYPAEVPRSFFKAVYIGNRINADVSDPSERSISIDRLKTVIRFFYEDLDQPHGWPKTTKFVKEFSGGKYFHLVKNYAEQSGQDKINRAFTSAQALQAGATIEAPYHIQLIQMAHKAKKEWEQQQREMNRLKENNEDMQDALKRAKAAGEKVRDQISRLEGILSVRGGDQSVIKSALSDIKQNMG